MDVSSVGQGKSGFRKELIKLVPGAFFTTSYENPPPLVDHTLVDILIPMKHMEVFNKREMRIITGAEMVTNMINIINQLTARTNKVTALIFDKSKYVPKEKGVVQCYRINDEHPGDEFVIPLGYEDDPAWIRRKDAWELKKRNYDEEKRQRQVVADRGYFLSKDGPVPLPWQETTSGMHRKKLVRFIMDMVLHDDALKYIPPIGKRIIIDGHHMKSMEGILEETDDTLPYFDIPIELVHPKTGMEVDKEKIITRNVGGIEIIFDSAPPEVSENEFAKVKLAPEFMNQMGEYDCAFVRYIVVTLAKGEGYTFTLNSTDSDILFLSLYLKYKLNNLMPKNLEDNTYGFTVEEMRRLIENAKRMQIYINYARDKKGNYCYCDVNKVYEWLCSKLTCTGQPDEHLIPSFLFVIAMKASDYTFGYYYISMVTNIVTFLAKFKEIGPLITFEGDKFDKVIINAKAVQKFIMFTYMKQYPKIELYYKANRMRFIEEFKSQELNIPILRQITLEKVVSEEYQKFVIKPTPEDLEKLFNMNDVAFDRVITNIAKALPPKKQIRERTKLLFGYFWKVNQYGNMKLINPKELKNFGFKRLRENEVWSSKNITMNVTNDYFGLEMKRKEYLLAKNARAAVYKKHDGTLVNVSKTLADDTMVIDSEAPKKKKKRSTKKQKTMDVIE